MRKVTVLLLLCSASFVIAQSSSQGQPTSLDRGGASSPAAEKQLTAEGCLSSASGNYQLIDQKNHQTYTLLGDSKALSPYVNQQVRIEGSERSDTPASTDPTGNRQQTDYSPRASMKSGISNVVNVTSVTKTGAACSTNPGTKGTKK